MIGIKRFYKRKGFTLLELLIVVIIVGILASLALPRFLRAAEKARWAEARSMLGTIRGAQIRYQIENGVYTANLADLDVEVPAAGTYFAFAAVNPGVGGGDVASATRNANQDGASLSGTALLISDAGVWNDAALPAWLR